MTVELEAQIEAFARWMEDSAGVPLHKMAAPPVMSLAPIDEDLVGLDLIPLAPLRRHGQLLLALAMAVTVIAAGSVALRSQSVTPAVNTGSSGDVRTEVTWYGLKADSPLLHDEVVANEREFLLCRELDQLGRCAAVVGNRSVTYAPSGLAVETEYGPVVSTRLQVLAITAEPGSIVGLEPTPGIRVTVTGSSASATAELLRSLEKRTRVVDLPIVFGETTATEAEFPKNGSVGARYFAGYVDGRRGCVGGVGIPWNNEETCVSAEPDQLRVVIASPSPAGTIVVATVPTATARIEASRNGQDPHPLSIIEAAAGYRVVFADLDSFDPDTLSAFDASGVAVGSIPVVSTGGAPLGYVQNENGPGPGIRVTDANVGEVVGRLGANVPLPPGVSLGDVAATLITNSDMPESTMAAIIEFNAACRWTAYWLDSNAKADAASKAEAQSHLNSLTDRPALLVGSSDGGVATMWRNIATAARANDPTAVADAGYRVNCTDGSLPQPSR
jgi:hypothetical protein